MDRWSEQIDRRRNVCSPVHATKAKEQMVGVEHRSRQAAPRRGPYGGAGSRHDSSKPALEGQGGGIMSLHVVEHPLVAHYLTRLRDRDTTPDEIREASDKIITLLL